MRLRLWRCEGGQFCRFGCACTPAFGREELWFLAAIVGPTEVEPCMGGWGFRGRDDDGLMRSKGEAPRGLAWGRGAAPEVR